jgi:hypothetical protein
MDGQSGTVPQTFPAANEARRMDLSDDDRIDQHARMENALRIVLRGRSYLERVTQR